MKHALRLLPVLALLAGCGGSGSADTTSTPATLNHVTVQLTGPAARHDGFYAAREQGFYTRAGLDVNLQAGKPAVNVVLTGRAELGVDRAAAAEAAESRGADVAVVGTLDGRTVLARGDWLKTDENADIAERFVEASGEGLDFCNDKPAQCAEISR